MAKDTIVNFVLDETGSMQIIKEATINGVNEYFGTLRNTKGRVYLTLTQFNSNKVEVVHEHVIMSKVPDLNEETYRPDLFTPLYDAIGKTIKATQERIDKRKTKPAVLFVIMTDGLENASKEYTQGGIFKLIEEKTKDGWTFVFLGANQDSYVVAQSMGIPVRNAANFVPTGAGVAKGMSVMGASTSNYLDSGSQQTDSFIIDDGTNEEEEEVEVTPS